MECKFDIENLTEEKLEELIDTLWNVNEICNRKHFAGVRINRYIMECKFTAGNYTATTTTELIDTLWNVNKKFTQFFHDLGGELIDTLWNVNFTESFQ